MISLIIVGLLTAVFDVTLGIKNPFFESTPLSHKDLSAIQLTTQSSSLMRLSTPSSEALDEGAYLSISPGNFSFDVESPIKTILTFCQSCQNKDTAPVDGNCCMPCDCSDRCYIAGTCCADMTNASFHHRYHSETSSTEADDKTCVDAFIIGENNQGLKNHSYLLFQKCIGNKDHQTNLKCLNPDVYKLDEMTPVFDRKTNRHYRNVYCLKCNSNADDVVFWNTRMTCKASEISPTSFPKLSRFNIFSIKDFIFINPDCALFWDPPLNEKKAQHCLSVHNIVSNCKTPILDNLCKQYYAPVKGRNIIFRNVFCMECNFPSKFTGRYEICSPFSFGFGDPPFISMLSLGLVEEMTLEPIISEFDICPSPKRFNNEIGTCLRHTCAVTEINTADKCTSVFSQLRNIHLEYRIKIRVQDKDIWSTFPQFPFDSDILAVVGLAKDSSNLCFQDILNISLSAEYLYTDIVVIKKVDADKGANIQQSYNEYVENIQVFNKMERAKDKIVLFQTDASDFAAIPADSVSFVKFQRDNLTYFCKNTIAMTKLQFCDTVTFHEDEFKINYNGTVSIDQLVFSTGEYVLRLTNGNIKTLQVCLSDYISRYIGVNGKYSVMSAGQYSWKSRIRVMYLLCAVIALKCL